MITFPAYFKSFDKNTIASLLGLTQVHRLPEPSRFNASFLKELALEEKNNPLWHILLMLKPVDQSFTMEDKINAYIQVMKHISAGAVPLNNSSALDQTQMIIKDLLDLVETPVSETYSPIQQIEAYHQIMQLIKNNQLKINNAPKAVQLETIAEKILTIAKQHHLDDHEAVALLKRIQTSIQTSIVGQFIKNKPDSIQNQYKSHLQSLRDEGIENRNNNKP